MSNRLKVLFKPRRSKEEGEYSIETCADPALNLPGNTQKCEAGSVSLFVVTAPCLFKH